MVLRELALFAGAGGGILGGLLCGFETVAAVEIDPYCREVLFRRQLDGCLPSFPVWDNVCTFDGRPWRGIVDVITGGFPCQDISCAGTGSGLSGSRSSLWFEMLRIIGEVRPTHVLIENSPCLRTRGLGTVLQGLASLGYDARWGRIGAEDVGAPHRRWRLWIVAYSDQAGLAQWEGGSGDDGEELKASIRGGWWAAEPGICRVVDGSTDRVDRIECLGNAQVPAVARLAWEILR